MRDNNIEPITDQYWTEGNDKRHSQNPEPSGKIKLMCSYCSDFYGSVLWDMSLSTVKSVCIAWQKGLRRVWDLSFQTHSRLIAPICELLPIRDELLLHCVNFINKCMSSENSVVRTVSYHGVFLRHMFSPIGANAIFCCNYLDSESYL